MSVKPTRREQELIELIARGLQTKAIANELDITEGTVRAHIANIMRKYQLHNRTQIAVMFLTQKILSSYVPSSRILHERHET